MLVEADGSLKDVRLLTMPAETLPALPVGLIVPAAPCTSHAIPPSATELAFVLSSRVNPLSKLTDGPLHPVMQYVANPITRSSPGAVVVMLGCVVVCVNMAPLVTPLV